MASHRCGATAIAPESTRSRCCGHAPASRRNLERAKPCRGFAWRAQSDQRHAKTLRDRGKLAPPAAVRCDRPEQDRVAAGEGEAERFAVAVPERLARDRARNGASEEPSEDERERIVEPNDQVQPRPDDVSRGAIVAV